MSTTEAPGGARHIGRSLRRKEDPRMITGRATYTDDLILPGTCHVAFVRSPEAHARIASIDATAAREREDVVAVFTGEDMADLQAPLPLAWLPPGGEVKEPDHWPLARGEVKHVGEPVAMVIGSDRYSVFDAAEDVIVEYDPLPALVDPEAALRDEQLLHASLGTNKAYEWSLGGGDIEAGFAAADVVVERRVVNQRTAGAAIEPRAVLAEDRAGALTIWSATQVPHFLRLFAAIMLGISEDRIRVIAPDVGGGFGSKLQVYGEEIACAWAARKLGRPVKWTATRSDEMAATHHGRDQIAHIRIGAKRDGTITALHARILADFGAYMMLLTPAIPALGAFVMTGVYRIPAVQTDIVGVFTNKSPTDAIRGAGRPEATHMIEVTIDQLAHELGVDRLELRRRNMIPPDAFPYETPYGIVYDSGNYPGALDKLLEHVDPAAEKAAAGDGKLRGVGFSTYSEICGFAPSRVAGPGGFGVQTGLWESAYVRVHVSGAVTVYTGASPHGQGHDTAMAQVAADLLGTDPQSVEVIHGDTATGPDGRGTYGSRTAAVGTEAIARAAAKVADKARAIVAHELEAAVEDIVLQDGKWIVRGSPDRGMTLAEVAGAAYTAGNLPEGLEPGLDEQAFYDPENFVFPFGAHCCVVDVDPETGKVEIVRYVAVDDCGRAINPMLVDGQIHGGVVHSIGQALYEQVVYDADGQLVTGTFVDYALPTAAEVPSVETDRTETPSPVNTLGLKGIGEAGTIAATAAVTNAVIDALRPLGVDYMDMPFTPMRVWQAIQAAKGAGAGPRATEQGRALDEHAGGAAGSGPTAPDEGGAP